MENYIFWSESGQDLEKRTEHPHQEFLGEPLRGSKYSLSVHIGNIPVCFPTMARKGHYNICFLLKLSRDNFNLSHELERSWNVACMYACILLMLTLSLSY